ncbi:MAG TPA: hypothetical protein VK625_06435 [Flavitalea sp.]|nr:hypothetical protein [Flavitalea sp.]
MKNLFAHSFLAKASLITLLFTGIFAVSAKAGLDSYEISLNNKVLIRQTVAGPIDLKNLPLGDAKATDNLVIRYSQCNAPNKIGKNRSISVRDADGRIVKEWKFKDSDGSNTAMTIPVKELLEIQNKSNGALSFHYSADGMQKTQKLAALQPGKKNNT